MIFTLFEDGYLLKHTSDDLLLNFLGEYTSTWTGEKIIDIYVGY